MNIEIMRKHYERTPKETLINVLVASREQVDKLQKRNKERKQEIERLNNIIKEVREYIEENQEEHKYTDRGGFTYTEGHFLRDSDTLLEILDKGEYNDSN